MCQIHKTFMRKKKKKKKKKSNEKHEKRKRKKKKNLFHRQIKIDNEFLGFEPTTMVATTKAI